MKIVRTFSQPIWLAVVWLIGFRPATYLIEQLMPNHTIPPTVLGTIDIAVLSSLIALIFSLWKPPIEITTKLINIESRRLHSNVDIKNPRLTLKVWLEVSVKVKNSKWINWSKATQKIGGVFVCLKENSLISHEIDSDYDSSMIKDIDGKPFIHLFASHFEIAESAELEYILHFLPDKKGVKTIEIIADIVPVHEKLIRRFIATIFIAIFIKLKHEKHPVYFN
ncbi:hypothetical protein J7E55_25920 [Bacillus sp. ISL-53]|nr:hypothetical protein [Bacillus sp. ISL-53]